MGRFTDKRLSEHFRLSEFVISQTAQRHGIDNTPPKEAIDNLARLAHFLEGVREACGDNPVVINSGYRCEQLNRMVGGSPTSAHMDGRAADIIIPGFGSPYRIAARLVDSGCIDDTLIYEGAWVHFGIAAPDQEPRRRTLTANFSRRKVTYKCGILTR